MAGPSLNRSPLNNREQRIAITSSSYSPSHAASMLFCSNDHVPPGTFESVVDQGKVCRDGGPADWLRE